MGLKVDTTKIACHHKSCKQKCPITGLCPMNCPGHLNVYSDSMTSSNICKIQDARKMSTISKLQSSHCHCTDDRIRKVCTLLVYIHSCDSNGQIVQVSDSDTFSACWINWVSHSLHNNKCKPPNTDMDSEMMPAHYLAPEKYRDGRKA